MLLVDGVSGVASRSAVVVVHAGPKLNGTNFNVKITDAFIRSGLSLLNEGTLPLVTSGVQGQQTVGPGGTVALQGASVHVSVGQPVQPLDGFDKPEYSIELIRCLNSGVGKHWSPAYHMCAGPAPYGFA